MQLVLNVSVEDEIEKKELEEYLLQQAKKFLSRRKKRLELVEIDYEDLPEGSKKIYNELFTNNGELKDLNRFKAVEDVF